MSKSNKNKLITLLLFLLVLPFNTGIAQAITINFESVTPESHADISTQGYNFSPTRSNNLVIRDSDSHALQPRWGDTLLIMKNNGSSFAFNSFEYQRQWASASGTVQIIGYQSNGNILQQSFIYDGNTGPTSLALNWSALSAVEMVLQGTVQLDNFVMDNVTEPPANNVLAFEEIAVGNHAGITSNGIRFEPVYNTGLVIRNSDTHALQPRWGDALHIRRNDMSTYNLQSFDYRRQWANASGTVQILGYQANGNILEESFSYNSNTVTTTMQLNWTNLHLVEFDFEGTLQLDNFVIPELSNDWYQPAPLTSWHIQLQGTVNPAYNVGLYDIDLFDTSTTTIQQLKNTGKKIICYFSAGSYEDWRTDAGRFNASNLGNALDGWPGEKWLDIRSDNVLTIMKSRLDLAVQKGCDGVDPDNMDGYSNNSGFSLTAADQINYNRSLANEAHSRSLSIGLKNDLDQIEELVDYFDFAVNEQCSVYSECDALTPFINQNKAVLNIEYRQDYVNNTASRNALCNRSRQLQFSTLILPLALDDSFRLSCP